MAYNILSLIDTCTGCFACANKCPKDAIALVSAYEGFYYPIIDETKCIDCGLCDKVCPAINPVETVSMKKAYYGWARSNVVRKESSSGGLFYHLASLVIAEDGVVYAAAFDYGETVRLTCHSTKDVSLKELMKSKYVQNYIGFAYRDILCDLNNGLIVLFCGTPCQVAGLKSFIKKDYKNLITVDFICHGVPSMDLLIKHLDYLHIRNVVDINFRPKNTAWYDDFEIKYKKNKNSKSCLLRKIPWTFDEYFYKLYAKNYSIRRCCKDCVYCNGRRPADITIGDFWGIKDYKPDLWDSKGISIFLANTDTAINIALKLIDNDGCVFEEMPISYAEYAFSYNRKGQDSEFQIAERDVFLKDVYSIGYKKALVKHNLITRKRDLLVYRIKHCIFIGLIKVGVIKNKKLSNVNISLKI